jgi:microcystin-dependent protein
MPDITIVKIKVRRGSDDQRKQLVLDQGELGYTIDTKRVFVGDGSLSGGRVVGNKNFGVFNLESGLGNVAGAQIGDIGYANSKLYTLTASEYDSSLTGWSYIGPVPDDENIEFTASNTITIKQSSLDANDITNSAFGSGLVRDGSSISIDFNSDFLELSSSKLSLKENSITEREITTTSILSGLVGGGGAPISINVGQGLEIDIDNRLQTSSARSNSVTFESFDTQAFGEGLVYNNTTNQIQSILSGVNSENFDLTNRRLSLIQTGVSGVYEMPQLSLDDYGIADTPQSTFFDCLTATTLTGADFVPVGAILPHAAAIGKVPDGYLLCNGHYLQRTDYSELFDVIGTEYGNTDANDFRLPNLTGGNILQYGSGEVYSSTQAWYLTGSQTDTSGANLSAIATNYIIKTTSIETGIFTGAPNQVSEGLPHSGTTYSTTDSDGNAQILSSAGFLTLALSGSTRNNGATFDRYAIPIFNY